MVGEYFIPINTTENGGTMVFDTMKRELRELIDLIRRTTEWDTESTAHCSIGRPWRACGHFSPIWRAGLSMGRRQIDANSTENEANR